MKTAQPVIDNMYFFMDESFDKVRRDFKQRFPYSENTRMFFHASGANMSLYPILPQVPLLTLPEDKRLEMNSAYNLSGMIRTPTTGNYGIVIPFLQEVVDYCHQNKIASAFSLVECTGLFYEHDPEIETPIQLERLLERLDRRRLSEDKAFIGERRILPPSSLVQRALQELRRPEN